MSDLELALWSLSDENKELLKQYFRQYFDKHGIEKKDSKREEGKQLQGNTCSVK